MFEAAMEPAIKAPMTKGRIFGIIVQTFLFA
jgi:hypothetical protein